LDCVPVIGFLSVMFEFPRIETGSKKGIHSRTDSLFQSRRRASQREKMLVSARRPKLYDECAIALTRDMKLVVPSVSLSQGRIWS
jgi:hypothetical protein